MIEVDDVTFTYSEGEQDVPPALQHVSLRIQPGEAIAIIGHNGSGKSTLTKLLMAMLRPQQGTIRIDGVQTDTEGDDLWTIRQRVGVVFQNPDDQLIASTVLDEIAFGPENLGLPREDIKQRVQNAMELLDLTAYADMSVSELAVSMKQRVAIAGVLAMRPHYLILDEPTTMISGRLARQLLDVVQDLAHSYGITVIHITHFMHEISGFDRVIVMDEGRVLMDGTPSAVFARADELQVAGLDVPLSTHLGRRLRGRGWLEVPEVVLFPEQLQLAFALPETAHGLTDPADHMLDDKVANRMPTSDLSDISSGSHGQAVFELRDVSYTYQRNTPFAQQALQDLSLAIFPGHTTALVGPPDAGKSTLIDLLAGLSKPEMGVLLFQGQDTVQISFKHEQLRRQVGIVFQSPDAQIFEETVGKDVSFGPRQQKVPLAESRRLVQESLEAVGLPYEEFRLRYTYALSGGQKRRVAIAGVLAMQPRVIIFDEPMAGLDPRGRNELLALLRALQQRHDLTIIYASSSLKDVVELADTIHVLEQGRVVFSGTPREVMRQAALLQRLDVTLPEANQIALSLRPVLPTLKTDVLDLDELETELLDLRPHFPEKGTQHEQSTTM